MTLTRNPFWRDLLGATAILLIAAAALIGLHAFMNGDGASATLLRTFYLSGSGTVRGEGMKPHSVIVTKYAPAIICGIAFGYWRGGRTVSFSSSLVWGMFVTTPLFLLHWLYPAIVSFDLSWQLPSTVSEVVIGVLYVIPQMMFCFVLMERIIGEHCRQRLLGNAGP